MTAFISYFNTENGRRSRYFEAFHGLLVFILLLYIFKYNFIYDVTEYNWIFIPEWLLIWIVPAFIKKIHGVESFAARFTLSFTHAFSIVHFLYLCGGLAAPGLIWLFAIPIVSAVLLGVYWAVLGNIFILGVLGVFLIFHEYGFGPNILAGADYLIEKFLNIALFVIFSGFMAISILWGERNSVIKLEEKHGDIENLLRVLLHDVANTLSFMTMSLFLARRRQNGSEHSGFQDLERMEKAIENISNLLSQVRTLKSAKDGKSSLSMKRHCLISLIKEGCDRARSSASSKGITFKLNDHPETIPVMIEKTIFVDIVFMNLMSNAIKFSPTGGEIEISVYSNCAHAVVEVRDYGIGMPKMILKDLFRVDVATSRMGTNGEKGTGYGMPLVHEYLKMMNGNLEVFSEESDLPSFPKGTLTVVRLPLTAQGASRARE